MNTAEKAFQRWVKGMRKKALGIVFLVRKHGGLHVHKSISVFMCAMLEKVMNIMSFLSWQICQWSTCARVQCQWAFFTEHPAAVSKSTDLWTHTPLCCSWMLGSKSHGNPNHLWIDMHKLVLYAYDTALVSKLTNVSRTSSDYIFIWVYMHNGSWWMDS